MVMNGDETALAGGGRKKTFRARRLTITRNDSITANVAAAAAAAAALDCGDSDEYDSPGEEEEKRKKQQQSHVSTKGDLITKHEKDDDDELNKSKMTTTTDDDTTKESEGKTDESNHNKESSSSATTSLNEKNTHKEEKTTTVPPDSEDKSRTFRERRLTFTKHQVTAAIEKLASASWAQDLSDDDDGDDNDKQKKNKRPPRPPRGGRRTSTASTCTTAEEALRSRTIHAGELLRVPLDSPASALKRSKLYMGPFRADYDDEKEDTGPGTTTAVVVGVNNNNTSNTNDDEMSDLDADEKSDGEQHDNLNATTTTSSVSSSHHHHKKPLWKRRMTRRHSELDCSLPFPRHVVGTYSAHGIEPLYDVDDDDYDEEDEELPPTTVAKINQDRGGVAYPYGNSNRQALFAVYDGHGHGGELVSQFALHHVQRRLERHELFDTNLQKAFSDVFESVNDDLALEDCMDPTYAGTTACAVLLRNDVLTISNAGDSRAVLGRRCRQRGAVVNDDDDDDNSSKSPTSSSYEAIALSQDQNPDVPEERKRIEDAGGFVSDPPEPGLSARVWLDPDHSQIGLAMARSIGDYAVKSIGVLATPVVTTHVLCPQDEVLIMATDGVWEFMSSQEAVDIVTSHLNNDHKDPSSTRTRMASSSSDDDDEDGKKGGSNNDAANNTTTGVGGAAKACQALIEAAANRWHKEEGDYRDDITALVICLQQLWDHEKGNGTNNNNTPKRRKVCEREKETGQKMERP